MAQLVTPMRLEYEHLGASITLEITPDGDGYRVRLPSGEEQRITARRLPNDIVHVTSEDALGATRSLRVPFARTDKDIALALQGESYVFTPPTPRRAGKTLSGALTAPMVGVVADVLVTEGQMVEEGQSLVILGAMKVYVALSAPFAGMVAKVYVKKDDLVAHGASVVDVEAIPANIQPHPEAGGGDA